MNKQKTLRTVVKLALVAAIYVALTLALYPLSYGSIQFRVSEFLMLLVSYNPLYAISLSVGCLLANIASPMGLIDVVFGTLATVISCIPMIFIKKNKYLSSLFPSIVNAIVIGLELYFAYSVPFYLGAIEVFAGEFVVVSLIGVPVFKSLEKNEKIVETLELKVYEDNSVLQKILKPHMLINLAILVVSLVMYFNLGVYYNDLGEGSYETFALSYFTFDNGGNNIAIILSVVLISFLCLLSSILLKNKVSSIVNISLNTIDIIMLIVSLVLVNKYVSTIDYRFYFYFVLYVVAILLEVYFLVKEIKKNNIDTQTEEIYNNI